MATELRIAAYLEHIFNNHPNGLTLEQIAENVRRMDDLGRPKEDFYYSVCYGMSFEEKPLNEQFYLKHILTLQQVSRRRLFFPNRHEKE